MYVSASSAKQHTCLLDALSVASSSPRWGSVRGSTPRLSCVLNRHTSPIEAVLCALIPVFSFAVTKPIAWNVATVTYPTVGWDSDKPELPLLVTKLHNRAA